MSKSAETAIPSFNETVDTMMKYAINSHFHLED